jgi:hypothetical protein
VLLAVGISTSFYVVVSFLYGPALAVPLTAAVAVLLAWLWYGIALVRRARS